MSTVNPSYGRRGFVASLGSSYGQLVSSAHYDADGVPLNYVYGDAAATDVHYTYDTWRRLREFKAFRVAPPLWSHATGNMSHRPGRLPLCNSL